MTLAYYLGNNWYKTGLRCTSGRFQNMVDAFQFFTEHPERKKTNKQKKPALHGGMITRKSKQSCCVHKRRNAAPTQCSQRWCATRDSSVQKHGAELLENAGGLSLSDKKPISKQGVVAASSLGVRLYLQNHFVKLKRYCAESSYRKAFSVLA